MPRIHMTWLATLALSAMPLVATAQASSDVPSHTYRFEQTGYSGGGVLSGMLTGRDLDGDGLITSRSGELDAFSLSFDAGTVGRDLDTGWVTGVFTQTQMLATIDVQRGEIFRVNQGGFAFFNDQFGVETAFGQIFDPISGDPKTLRAHAGFLDAPNEVLQTFNPLVLTAVPEPTSTAMGAVGLLAVAALARNRRRKQAADAA